jgi:hypothetical protein
VINKVDYPIEVDSTRALIYQYPVQHSDRPEGWVEVEMSGMKKQRTSETGGVLCCVSTLA